MRADLSARIFCIKLSILHKMYQRKLLLKLLACGIALIPGAVSAQDDATMSAEELEAFLADPAMLLDILEGDTQSGATAPESVTPSGLLFTTSIRTGVGHSNNFLKKYAELQKSDYLQIEFDAFASWKFAEMEMSSMAFAETTLYDFDLEPSEEVMGYILIDGMLNKGAFDYGFSSSFLYGSFIYDASLTAVSVPSGTEIRQTMPQLELFADWYAWGSNRFRLAFDASRPTFNLESLDYWEPNINLEWEHAWSSSLRTTSSLDVSRQLYDEELARTANGTPIAQGATLEVTRIAFNQKLNWKPRQWKWLQTELNLGIAWEDENEGAYEALRQSWIQGRMTISNAWGRFKFSARWGEYRYDDRQVSLFDTRLHLQTNQSLSIEYSRQLPWNLTFIARNHWSALKSRIYEDTYSERRSEVLLQWSY